MIDSVLFPPNNHRLTDTVIRGVVQRVQSQFHGTSSDTDNSNDIGLNCTISTTFKRSSHAAEIGCNTEDTSSVTKTSTTKPKPMLMPSGEDENVCLDQETDAAYIEHQRRRRRIYQRRYRQKQNCRAIEIEKDVRFLQDQIRQLKRRRLHVLSGIPINITPWQVIAEYCSIFRYGLKSTVDTQKKFLERALSRDVVTKSGFGVEPLLADWEAQCSCHEDLEFKLERIELEKENIILAIQTSYSTITKKTLHTGFPHLLDGDTLSPIAKKLLGQRLVVPTVGRFEWDGSIGRIVRIHYTSDLMTPLLKLLGSLEDVACVLYNPCFVHR